MNNIKYSQDVDILLVELSNENIAYAEAIGNVIFHYSETDQVVLVEILNFRQSIPKDNLELMLQLPQSA